MAFRRILLPVVLTYGSSGGPRWMTDVVETDGPGESRNQRWQYPRHEYEARFNGRVHYSEISEFLGVLHGRLHSCLAWDPLNHAALAGQGLFVDSEGSPAGKQMIKRVTKGGYPYDILVTKPDEDNVVITGGGTLDPDTGIVYGGTPTSWVGPFWKQVRSLQDFVKPVIDAKRRGAANGDPDGYFIEWEPIGLIEVHENDDES